MSYKAICYNKRVKYLLLIVAIQIFVIYCFRDYDSLPDLPGYVMGYEHVRNYGYDVQWSTGMRITEPGWICLNILLSNLCSNPWMLLAFTGGIILFGHFKTYLRYSGIPWLSVYLFLCTMFCQSLYVLRQHIAIALCLLAIPYIVKRKIWPFLCIIILATSIHTTAIVFLISYWIYPLRVGMKFVMLCICIGIVMHAFLLNSFVDIIGSSNIYASYAEGEKTNATAFLISLCVIVLAMYSIPLKKMQNELKLFFILSCIATCINIGGMGISITGRLNMYFTVFSILLIPNAINELPKKLQIITITLVMLAYTIFCFSSISYVNGAKYLRLTF